MLLADGEPAGGGPAPRRPPSEYRARCRAGGSGPDPAAGDVLWGSPVPSGRSTTGMEGDRVGEGHGPVCPDPARAATAGPQGRARREMSEVGSETNVPTQHAAPQEDARVPNPDAHPRRPGSDRPATSEGSGPA